MMLKRRRGGRFTEYFPQKNSKYIQRNDNTI